MTRFARVVRFILGTGGLALFAMAATGPAQAGICANAASCDFHLTNTQFTGVTVDILVNVDNTGPTTVLNVSFVGDNVTQTPLGMDQFGFNSLAGTTSLSPGWSNAGCPQPPGPPPPGCQMDGFGRFASEVDKSPGADLSFSITLDSLVTSFDENASGGEFAAHIRYSDGCSTFVSDGTTTQSTSTCFTLERPPVPEPNSISLLGIALLALVGVTRLRGRAR